MKSNRIRIALWTAALLAAGTAPAHAQLDMVEGLFEEVNAVTIFMQRDEVSNAGRVTGDNLNGAGLEVLIDLVSGGMLDLELGLGASFMRGYGSVGDSLKLHTSVRALPTVSLYMSGDIVERRYGALSGYGGLSFGLVDLWNAQAYDIRGRPWSVEAQTFEYGGSLGLYVTTPAAIGAFIEGGYRERRFPSLKWTVPEGDSVPTDWRSLNLSGPYLQFGFQLRVKEDDRNDDITPPAPAGVWTLERMDGAALPGTRDSATVWNQVLGGVLRLTPSTDPRAEGTGQWTLNLNLRERTKQRDGTSPVTGLPTETITGTYTTAEKETTREHVLTLIDGNGGRWEAERLAGRLYLNWNGHVLTFAPGNTPPPSK